MVRKEHSSDKIFIFIIFVVGIDLLTTGSVTWSVWPAGSLLFFYLITLSNDGTRGEREFTILKERFAKGDLSEEEFLRQKEILESDSKGSGVTSHHLFGVVLIALGGLLFVSNLLPHMDIPLLPVILIIIGLFAMYRNMR